MSTFVTQNRFEFVAFLVGHDLAECMLLLRLYRRLTNTNLMLGIIQNLFKVFYRARLNLLLPTD